MPYLAVPLLALVVVAQTTVVPATALGGTKPFLPLLFVVTWGLLRGPLAGAWWALTVGLMLDIVSPSPSLFYTVPLLLAVGVVALSRGRLFPSNLLMPWLVVIAATVAFVVAQRALLPLVGGSVGWLPATLMRELLPETALNLLWLPIAYFPLHALARRVGGPRIDWER